MALFPGIKRPEHLIDRLIESNADVKDDCNHTFTPPAFLRESAGRTLSLFGNIYWYEINKWCRGMTFGRSHEKIHIKIFVGLHWRHTINGRIILKWK
jgi:hypothetical protein